MKIKSLYVHEIGWLNVVDEPRPYCEYKEIIPIHSGMNLPVCYNCFTHDGELHQINAQHVIKITYFRE